MNFNHKEKRAISALLILLYLIPAGLEWLQFDQGLLSIVAISLPIWLTFFFLGPFWLFYLLQKTQWVSHLSIFIQALIYVVIMFIGANLVSTLHLLAFPDYKFSLEEQIVSALLWGVFIFSMTQMYLLYLRFMSEQKLRKEAQWTNLTNRLNPHFLFNALNTISALIHSSPQKADEVLHKLADILRYSVEQQKEWVPLEQELRICHTYLNIEQSRFTDNLMINWQVDKALQNAAYKVPPLLLQPLIENVVKHVKARPIKLEMSVHRHNDQLTFQVRDNGDGFNDSVLKHKTQTGQGLDIVRKRVAIAGGTLSLDNQSRDAHTAGEKGGAVCTINLPIQQCV